MDEKPYRKLFQCSANLVLAKAVSEFIEKNGFTSERKAIEHLLREALTQRGHLPASRV